LSDKESRGESREESISRPTRSSGKQFRERSNEGGTRDWNSRGINVVSARELRRVDDGEQSRNSLVIRAQVRPHVTGDAGSRGGDGTRGEAREKVGARATRRVSGFRPAMTVAAMAVEWRRW